MPTHMTENYGTVQARIPIALVQAVQRYAAMHRLSVSELIRDGLEWRIEQETPGLGWTPRDTQTGEASSTPADVVRVLQTIQHTIDELCHDVRHVLQAQETRQPEQHEAVGHVPQDHTALQPEQTADVLHVLQTQAGECQRGREAVGHVPQEDTSPTFDAAKFYLSDLCTRGHDYQGTGKSLLRKGNRNCVACQRELRRTRHARLKHAGLTPSRSSSRGDHG